MLIRCFRVDLLKMKRLPITYAHIVIPFIMSVLFLGYYSFCGWGEYTKVSGFYEAVGIGFPILIGIFTANMMELEQNAGEYQNLLSSKYKLSAFMSKVVILVLYSLISLVLTTAIFGVGMWIMNKSANYSFIDFIRSYLVSTALIWLAGIPLYIWQTVIAFKFGKTVSIGTGILGGLVSALMLTGMGDTIWKYIPFAWTARFPALYLQGMKETGILRIFILVITGSLVYYVFWASRFEGRKISE